MIVCFYSDPIDRNQVCSDLIDGFIVVLLTTRTNARVFESDISSMLRGGVIIPSAVEVDHEWHSYLVNSSLIEYEIGATESSVAKALNTWNEAGSPRTYRVEI